MRAASRRGSVHDWDRAAWALPLLLILAAAIYVGSAGMPALLDDTDSLYAEVAREMNLRRDWITPYANAIRYLEKPPLFYWLMSLSYAVFGTENEFTARLPTALAMVGLTGVTFAIGKLLFGVRAGVLAGLAITTSAGPFLFTRIVMPDALLTLLLALFFYAFLRWERAIEKAAPLLWMYALAAGAVLAKGLIGLVFPAAIVLVTLVAKRQWRDIWQLISWPGIALFLAIAAPWHVLAEIQNPGFSWYYFVHEHVLRFLGQRYPKDYGAVPLGPFWLLHLVWLFPWSFYLLALATPGGLRRAWAAHGDRLVLPIVWTGVIVVFFSLSSRLEYYTMPAFPALAVLAGAQCEMRRREARAWPDLLLAGVGLASGIACAVAAAIDPAALSEWLRGLYDDPERIFYLDHLFDMSAETALNLRAALLIAGVSLAVALPLHCWIRRAELRGVTMPMGMLGLFAATSLALATFSPQLTTKPLADEINRRAGGTSPVVLHLDFEEASSIAFYTRMPVLLHDSWSVNLDHGARFPDASPLVLDDEALRALWSNETDRAFLITSAQKEGRLPAAIRHSGHVIAKHGDKLLLSNFPREGETTRRPAGLRLEPIRQSPADAPVF